MSNLLNMVHKEGYVFIVIAFLLFIMLGRFSAHLGWIGLVLTCFCIYFFRNPIRYVPKDPNAVIAPADGKIVQIVNDVFPGDANGAQGYTRISIFLNVFNVHVNRIPMDGKITKLEYRPGKFINASLDKASVDNERQICIMENKFGTKIAFVQIAGLIAKRIVCDIEEGQEVYAGDRFGIIRFGSRMDVFLPKAIQINVCEGQTIIGGETILAEFNIEKKTKKHFKII